MFQTGTLPKSTFISIYENQKSGKDRYFFTITTKTNMENYGKTLRQRRMSCEQRIIRRRKKVVNGIQAGIIRQKIWEYYETEKEVPTLAELTEMLENDELKFDHKHLKKLLHELGYRYLRCQSPSRRHLLVEKYSLAVMRKDYITEIRECRANKRNIYFMHETYMEAYDVEKRRERYLRIELPAELSEYKRLVILHAGGPNGLMINGSFRTIKADYEFDDHFGEVNTPKFEKWVTENLMDKLQPRSVIAISSARHHSIQKHKRPRDLFTTRTAMEDWLMIHSVEYEGDLLDVDLLQLIRNTHALPVYAVDQALNGLGHTVLRIPPIHAELNPLEYVWDDMRKKIAHSHADASVEDKKKIWRKLYSEYPAAEYQKWEDIVKKIEDNYHDKHEKEYDIMDDIIERYEKDLISDTEDWTTDNTSESESDFDF